VQFRRFLKAANATRSAATATDIASGFSQRTCLPAKSASSKWGQSVGRTDFDGVNRGICKDCPLIRLASVRAKFVCIFLSRWEIRVNNGGNINKCHTANRLGVNPAYEARAAHSSAKSIGRWHSLSFLEPILHRQGHVSAQVEN
jgi:hypothetical protein